MRERGPIPSQSSSSVAAHASAEHDSRWQQVLARDPRADGVFFYGVRTTGIFCRPGCPSRRPAAHNVLFFDNAAQARAAGFRSCLRCTPDQIADRRREIVSRAAELLLQQDPQHTTLAHLAQATGAGRLSLMRGFRQVLGLTPAEFARAIKLARFRDTLKPSASEPSANEAPRPTRSRQPTITEAIYEAGFGSSSRVYQRSTQQLGMTPRTLSEGGTGMTIRYATAATPLGQMLVAATGNGVCAILFGTTDSALLADLRLRFRRAELVPAQPHDINWLADAVAYVVSQTTEHPLAATFPFDVRATAFQQRVWKALLAIPRGETRSYSDVARSIGHSSAVRAVGAAIGANPIAVAVPCHRVLGKDGSMTGYRWGLERKQQLLAAERLRPTQL